MDFNHPLGDVIFSKDLFVFIGTQKVFRRLFLV